MQEEWKKVSIDQQNTVNIFLYFIGEKKINCMEIAVYVVRFKRNKNCVRLVTDEEKINK